MTTTLSQAFVRSFLGHAPGWYKLTIAGFLVANPLLVILFGPVVTGWALLAEFIFTLAMALRCYPLQPGGLLAIESVLIGLTNAESVYREVTQAVPVILLLIFMVAGIYFLRDLLLYVFTRLLLKVHSSSTLAVLFCGVAAFLSSFLDALTVVAVAITVGVGFYEVYHRVASGKHHDSSHDATEDEGVHVLHRDNLEQFRAFLRGLMMHAAIGTAIGGVMTQVGEPQNLLIAEQAGWNFVQFFLEVAPVSIPVAAAGLLTCWSLDRFKLFGYGAPLPDAVRAVLRDYAEHMAARSTVRDRQVLIVQAVVALTLVLGLAFHIAEVGLIGLVVIILATSFTGVIEEHQIGKAFEAALPFTALLVVFFVIVAGIHDQHLFEPVMHSVLALEGRAQAVALYCATGVLSAISDNVFVASIYITEIKSAFLQGVISREQFDAAAVAINTGTNIPSVATPNGQAAFLFLLTSTLAPLIRLGYLRMIWMALPYFVVMTTVGLAAVVYLL
jgi:Na+:H+ antiporter, NhaB family